MLSKHKLATEQANKETPKLSLEEAEQKEARDTLRKILKPGMTVYTILRHRSSSGMFRLISVVIPDKKGDILCLDWYIDKLGLYIRDKNREGLRVGGCGMDMGFSVVYDLGSSLWPRGDGKYITHRNGDTKPETDGGYLLNRAGSKITNNQNPKVGDLRWL